MNKIRLLNEFRLKHRKITYRVLNELILEALLLSSLHEEVKTVREADKQAQKGEQERELMRFARK